MNKSLIKITLFAITMVVAILNGTYLFAQIPFLNELSKSTQVNDTTGSSRNISIDNVNKEIEFTDNLIAKTNISKFSNEKQESLIKEIEVFNTYIANHGKEFKQFETANVTHFFLINAKFSWTEYSLLLRNYQEELQRMIREIQEQQSFYVNNRKKWENSLPDLERSLTVQIKSHIDSNLKEIDVVINDFDLKIRNLITSENKIIQDIIYVGAILSDISRLNEKRRSELFTRNEKNIFSLDFGSNRSGSFTGQLNLTFRETVNTFSYFYSSVKRNIFLYLTLILFLISYFLFVRKNYIKLNYNEHNPGFFRIDRIVVQKPFLTLLALVIFLWTVVIPYSPLVLNLFLFLSVLVILLLILSPVMDPFIKKVEIAVIILLALSNLELLTSHFDNFYRFYLIFESAVGIWLTYKFVLPGYKIEKFRNQNKELVLSARIIILLIFIYYSISFVSNILGFLNLSVFVLKLGAYTGVISLMVHGFYRIISSLIQAGIDVLNISYPGIVRKFGNSINYRLNRALKLFLGFLWISGILRISEIYEFVSSRFIAIFTDKVKIGSLSFTLGKLLLFIAVLYLTYIIAKFIKLILEREVLAKHGLKRGLAASISLTIRIFIVFFGALVALSVSGLDFSKIGIIAGALSVGIGFGLQNVVSNFISGLILVYEKPVQEGDTIEVDSLLGRVSNIGIRSSTVTTYSGAEVVVPNSNLISNQLINWTLSDNRKRIEVKVGTAYGTNPVQILEILQNAALHHGKVLQDPKPLALFEGFGDSSLNFRLLFWVPFEDGLQTQSDVAIEVYKLFKENKIEIPFPQLDLHVKNAKHQTQDNDNIEATA